MTEFESKLPVSDSQPYGLDVVPAESSLMQAPAIERAKVSPNYKRPSPEPPIEVEDIRPPMTTSTCIPKSPPKQDIQLGARADPDQVLSSGQGLEEEKIVLREFRQKPEWTEEETQTIFRYYKKLGCRWAAISRHLSGRSENDVKNRFYATLKRVATQAQLEDPINYNGKFSKCKKNLIQFVDAAIAHGQYLSSKRGRKRNSEKAKARKEGFLFPKPLPSNKSIQPPTPPPPPPALPQTRPLQPAPPVIQYAAMPVMPYGPLPPQPLPPPYPLYYGLSYQAYYLQGRMVYGRNQVTPPRRYNPLA